MFNIGAIIILSSTAWMCEVDPWRRKLLARNFPGVPCHPDLTTLDPVILTRPDVLIGGTPCQDLSVAGQRAGLDGARSGLFFDYLRIRHALNIEWCVWENVHGALSSNAGLDFACILGAFVGASVDVPAGGWPGAGVASGPFGGVVWRVLDAQHFGVPQRRRRVFVVGRLGGPCPPEVLFEPARSQGHPPAGAEARQGVAAPLTRGSSRPGVSEPGRRQEDDTNLVAGTLKASGVSGGRTNDVEATYVVNALDTQRGGPDENSAQAGHFIAGSLTRRMGKGVDSDELGMPLIAHTLRAGGFDASEDGTGRGTPLVTADQPYAARARPQQLEPGDGSGDARSPGLDGASPDPNGVRAPDVLAGRVDRAVSFAENQRGEVLESETAGSLKTGGGKPGQGYQAVRISAVASRSASSYDPLPDGRRYAACGDGVVANVAEWIGHRLARCVS